MDLRAYYRKLKEIEATLQGDHMVLVSVATPEGGKEGVMTEAPRTVAAKMMAEGRARLATAEETEAFRELNRQAKAQYDEDQAARRLQVMVVPSHELRKPKERS